MKARAELAHALKLKFKLAPDQPTDYQLELILEDIGRIEAVGREPSEADWANIVDKRVPQSGKHFYGGLDYSDLNALFAQAKKQSK